MYIKYYYLHISTYLVIQYSLQYTSTAILLHYYSTHLGASAGLTSPQYEVAQEVNVISSAYNRINQLINE